MSSSESFGIVLLEAWMAGKPVIANNSCAAFHDLAIDDHNALLVDDVRSLRQAIKRLLSDQELCDRLAENGKGLLK
jgi:glycosyltransferase involved in cell wall biosynthesis